MIGDLKGGAPAGVAGMDKDGGGKGLGMQAGRAGMLGTRPARVIPPAYQASSTTERLKANAYPIGSESHDHYNAGWDHAVISAPRTAAQRAHPIFQRGVVNGLSWKRRNPADF